MDGVGAHHGPALVADGRWLSSSKQASNNAGLACGAVQVTSEQAIERAGGRAGVRACMRGCVCVRAG